MSVLTAKDRILVAIHLLNEKDKQSIIPTMLRRATTITHDKLANLTGLTRETVTKQVQELQKEGLVMSEKKMFTVTEAGKAAVEKLG